MNGKPYGLGIYKVERGEAKGDSYEGTWFEG